MAPHASIDRSSSCLEMRIRHSNATTLRDVRQRTPVFAPFERKAIMGNRVRGNKSRQFRFRLIIFRSLGNCARAIGGIDMDETDTGRVGSGESDQKDLAGLGYKQ